jgi:putative Mn2+ efflux pump MntP
MVKMFDSGGRTQKKYVEKDWLLVRPCGNSAAGLSMRNRQVRLFLASFLALYFELVASFFGLGVGMILGEEEKRASVFFPFTTLALFLLIHFAPMLGLTHLPMPNTDYMIWGENAVDITPLLQPILYVGVVTLVSTLVVFFCMPLGSLIGRYLKLS